MALKIVHDTLIADPTVNAAVGQRISPVQSQQNEPFPRIVLTTVETLPQNALSGFAGIDKCHVQADAWAADYKTAESIANAVRNAMSTAGYLTVQKLSDAFHFETDVSAFRVGYVFQVWQ